MLPKKKPMSTKTRKGASGNKRVSASAPRPTTSPSPPCSGSVTPVDTGSVSSLPTCTFKEPEGKLTLNDDPYFFYSAQDRRIVDRLQRKYKTIHTITWQKEVLDCLRQASSSTPEETEEEQPISQSPSPPCSDPLIQPTNSDSS